MQKKETKSSILFRHWIHSTPYYSTASFEMKDTRGKSYLYLAEIKSAQIDYGLAIKNSDKGVLIRTTGVEGLPDYIYLRKEPACVVIKYPTALYIIDIEKIVKEKKKSKSLTEARASVICETKITL